MPIFDQFETEPYVTYSGSYTDRYYYGSIFNDNYSTTRSAVALKTTGILSSSFFAKDFGRSEEFGYVSGTYIANRTQNFATKHYSTELIYNSLTPSPIGIARANQQLLPYLETTSSWQQVFSASLDGSPKLNRPNLTEDAAHIFLTAQATEIPLPSIVPYTLLSVPSIQDFTSVNWLYQYPFESKFKGLQKYVGTALDNIDIEVDLYSGSFLSPPINTKQLGSLFYTYGDGSFKRYVQYSQIWHAVGINRPEHKHVYTKSFNGLQKVYFTNYNQSGVSSCYVAFGENSTILTSSNGLSDTWKTICANHGSIIGDKVAVDYSIHPSPKNIPMEIDLWPVASGSGSIRDALPIGYPGGGGITPGQHFQWLTIVEFKTDMYGSNKGKLVRSKPSTHTSNKIPTKDQWEFVDLDGPTSKVNLFQIGTNNPSGAAGAEFEEPICIVGESETFGSNKYGYIAYANNIDAAQSNWVRNIAGIAAQADVVWYSIATPNSYGAATTTYNYFWVCGADNSVFPGVGIIARATAAPLQSLNPYVNITPGSPSPMPITRAIAYNHASDVLICVGDNGLILRSDDAGNTWTTETPALGYTGNFVDVKVAYEHNTTKSGLALYYFVIVGDDGEIQYSGDGSAWLKSPTEYPNRISGSSGLGSSLDATYGKNITYTNYNRNNSIKNYYAGSIEKYYVNTLDNPPDTIAVGGVSTHDFNEETFDPPPPPYLGTTFFDTILTCRLADASGSWNDKENYFLPHYNNRLYSPQRVATPIKPTDYDYNKAFFGYGDGFSLDLTDWNYGGPINVGRKGKTPNFLDWSPYDLYGNVDVPQFNLYNPQIRGWKYGLYSGINTPSSAIWRRGRYGQFRDMLEQRIFAKYIQLEQPEPYSYPKKGIKRTVDGPVKVNFVSGSAIYTDTIDYVTATNPSYNPYDSGIYDTEYRSGQPFFDRPNED